jgi:hypothetical protein
MVNLIYNLALDISIFWVKVHDWSWVRVRGMVTYRGCPMEFRILGAQLTGPWIEKIIRVGDRACKGRLC